MNLLYSNYSLNICIIIFHNQAVCISQNSHICHISLRSPESRQIVSLWILKRMNSKKTDNRSFENGKHENIFKTSALHKRSHFIKLIKRTEYLKATCPGTYITNLILHNTLTKLLTSFSLIKEIIFLFKILVSKTCFLKCLHTTASC